jgi:glutathione S-transferase
MLTVHHLNNSRSQRVLWLLEELGAPYEVKRYERMPNMLAPPELKAVHPLGKSPVITDEGLTVAETGAIVEYILDRYGEGRLRPAAGSVELNAYRYWLHYAEGSAMPPLLIKLIFNTMPSRAPALMRPIVRSIAAKGQAQMSDPQLKTHFDFWESTLARHAWFAGPEFTAADIMMSFPVEAGASRGGGTEGRPRVRAFLEAIHARPAYKRALERGGPYAYAE